MTRCTTPGCLRKPVYPDQAKCAEHRVRWTPNTATWLRRIADPVGMGATTSIAKDMTRSAA